MRSCGTDTRDSVPCMFSPLGKAAFEKRKAEHENLLDLLQAAGLAVLWLDNQSGCKDVCNRVPTATTADLPADVAAGCAAPANASTRRCWSASTSASPGCPRSGAGRASSSSCTRWAATARPTTSARRRR